MNKQQTAVALRKARLAKGLTQQELAEQTKLSLRSIQRIENAEVTARSYTLRLLFATLELEWPNAEESFTPNKPSQPLTDGSVPLPIRNVILSVVLGICIVLFSAAFLAQSPTFPETSFELFAFWGCVTSCYLIILLCVFKISNNRPM